MLVSSNRDLSQRGVQRDLIPTAVEQRLRMRGAIETIIGKPLNRSSGRDSIHGKVGNNLLCLEGRSLYGCVDGCFQARRHVHGDIADAGLTIHVQIAVDIFWNKVDHDVPGSCRSLDPGGRAVEPDITRLRVTLERTPHPAAGD